MQDGAGEMDENGDAPEHKWVRWRKQLQSHDRRTFMLGGWLTLIGILLISAGWFTGIVAPNPISAFLDKLGWAAFQLGAAVILVNFLLARARAEAFKPLITEAQFELKQLTATALNPIFLKGPLQSLGRGEPMDVRKLDQRLRDRRELIRSHRRDTILRTGVAVQHDQVTLDMASAILDAINAEDDAARYLISAAHQPVYLKSLPVKLETLQQAYKKLNTFEHFAMQSEVQSVIDAIPAAIDRLNQNSAAPDAP
ncbi:hypothetical protein OA2633_00170 [Oceanicaulis sp. HTCC2633]|nr:hypothetical protein OA2633_00170 [Oceanicaulis sp. HTCC2633]